MATNRKYAAAFEAYDKARIAREQTEERHKIEMEQAIKNEREALRLMIEARDSLENWV